MLNNFFPVIDLGYQRIKTTLETGSDPGEQDPQTLLAKVTGERGPTMPPQLKPHPDQPQEKDGDKLSGESATESEPEITEI